MSYGYVHILFTIGGIFWTGKKHIWSFLAQHMGYLYQWPRLDWEVHVDVDRFIDADMGLRQHEFGVNGANSLPHVSEFIGFSNPSYYRATPAATLGKLRRNHKPRARRLTTQQRSSRPATLWGGCRCCYRYCYCWCCCWLSVNRRWEHNQPLLLLLSLLVLLQQISGMQTVQ